MYKSLWQRTQNVASAYTGTFIVVMLLNQLLFFGFCLNPVCLIAAMPHVLFITAIVGSWINKLNNWGAGKRGDPLLAKNRAQRKKPKSEVPRLYDGIADVLDAGTEALKSANKKLNVVNVTLSAKSAYNSERWFVESMLKLSKQKLEIEEQKKDPDFKKIYDEIEKKFDGKLQKRKSTGEVRSLANFTLPAEVEGSSNESEIKLAVLEVVTAHNRFLEQTKRKLESNPALMAIFEDLIVERGGREILAHLKTITPVAPRKKGPVSQPRGKKKTSPSNPRCEPSTATRPVPVRTKRTDTGLYGSLSRELFGNWTGGYYCDLHTTESKCLGENEHGKPTWSTARTEMGELIYRLKYKGDYAAVSKIVELVNKQITAEGFDYIIPVPASKIRQRQPVDEIAQAFGERISVPVLNGFLRKSTTQELKEMENPKARERLLKESIDIVGSEDISAMNVLLVDDLYRSGATLRACCDVLLEAANVGEVWVLTMTKTRYLR